MNTFSNAYGLISPTGSNQHAITFNDDLPPRFQDVLTTTEATSLIDDTRCLRRDDVTSEGYTIVNDVNNDSEKYFHSKDDHVERSDQDAGTFNFSSMSRTTD